MKLPRVSGKQTINALIQSGFVVHRIRGSHYLLKHPETGRRVTVPYHRKELAPKTIRSILKQSGISLELFSKLI